MKALTNYRPGTFGPRVLENVLSDFDRYMDSFFGDTFHNPSDRLVSRVPPVDVRETEKAYVLEMELPGFTEKDIEIRLDGNNLTVNSNFKKEANEEPAAKEEGNYLIRERRLLSFVRSFKLPENADPEGISASFRNGILFLELGKKAETQARVIQISKN